MKKYYFANEWHIESIYGEQNPICIDENEVRRLSAEWGVDLFEQMHEASKEEIKEFGIED